MPSLRSPRWRLAVGVLLLASTLAAPAGVSAQPATPVPLSPAYGSSTEDATPTFDWSDVTGGGVTYGLQVDNNADFSSPEIDQAGLTSSTFTPTGLLAEGTYFWRVRAADGVSTSAWSTVFSVTVVRDTTPPAIPQPLTPANGATIADSTPSFDWTDVSDLNGVTYRLQVDNNADFSSPEIDQAGLTSSTFTPTGLLAEGTYFWRVRAADNAGNPGAFSTVFTVSVAADADQQLAALTTSVDTSLASGAITQGGTATSLKSHLSAAQSALQRGNATAAKNQLNAFINQVQAERGKSIGTAAADALIAQAQALLAGIP